MIIFLKHNLPISFVKELNEKKRENQSYSNRRCLTFFFSKYVISLLKEIFCFFSFNRKKIEATNYETKDGYSFLREFRRRN